MYKIIIATLFCLPMTVMAKATYSAQTNHFALKKGQDWSWAQVAKTPNIKWENKTPKNNGAWGTGYGVFGEMGEYGYLSVNGTKAKPTIIHFHSGQTYQSMAADDEFLYRLHDLFDESELTRLRSNCTVKRDSEMDELGSGYEYQYFYKWQKKGYKPLYLAVNDSGSENFSGGVIITYIIVQDFNSFNDKKLESVLTRHEDSRGNNITCRIL